MVTLRKLTSNINLFQLKGQDLALSNDMHVFLQMTSIRSAILISGLVFDVNVTLHTRCIILIDQARGV